MLSAPADALLRLLQSLPGRALCQLCTARRLTLSLHATLGATNELQAAREIGVGQEQCIDCRQVRLVVRLRRPPSAPAED
jgi:hypothetical protein